MPKRIFAGRDWHRRYHRRGRNNRTGKHGSPFALPTAWKNATYLSRLTYIPLTSVATVAALSSCEQTLDPLCKDLGEEHSVGICFAPMSRRAFSTEQELRFAMSRVVPKRWAWRDEGRRMNDDGYHEARQEEVYFVTNVHNQLPS